MQASTSQVTTTAIQAAQQYGTANVFAGAVVGLFMSNSKKSVENRQIMYRIVLMFELLYISLLVWQAFMMEGGMMKGTLLKNAAHVLLFVVWRGFTLGWKEEWFGRWVEGRKMD